MATGLDSILPHVARPARYTGNEWNSTRKDWPGRLHVALAYPDVYEEAICDAWTLSIYGRLNSEDDVLCERAYVPWPDMDQALCRSGLPLYALESGRPLAAFDVVLVVLPDELHFPSVLTLLALAGLPLHAAQRTAPPVIAGIGPGTANPQPLADFCDAFIMGEVEIRAVRAVLQGERRVQVDGTSLPPPLLRPIVPFVESRHERAEVELSHPPLYPWVGHPSVERPLDEILASTEAILTSTGYDHVHLTGRHSRLAAIVASLSARYGGTHIHVSLDNIPMTVQAIDLADRLPRTSRGALALDPMAGSERLRTLFGVTETDAQILDAARLAFRSGWHILRLTASLGLPGETDADIEALGALARRLRDIGREEINGQAQVQLTLTPFIARAGSPLLGGHMAAAEDRERRVAALTRLVRGPGLRLQWRGLETRPAEAALARGDRRVGAVVEAAWSAGMRRPEDTHNAPAWQAAFQSAGLDIEVVANEPGDQ
jgi:radical SAM superfamily enzyme YgiQ (UPF0313 family)